MESYTVKHLNFSYPGHDVKVLDELSFSIPRGQFVLLCGTSGCGKTTLLRQLKTVLTPKGIQSGLIYFENTLLAELNQRTQSSKIGFVLQSPDNQIVTDKVWHELAFGLENLGLDTKTIRLRVAEMSSFFGIQNWFHQDTTQLSGGQKQLLNLAAIMLMQPAVLILDEPLAQLDPLAATEFLAILAKINRELGITIIMTEHRLEEVLPLAQRVLVMDKGRIIADGTPAAIGTFLQENQHSMYAALPTPLRISTSVKTDLACPLTVGEGRLWLDSFAKQHTLGEIPLNELVAYPATVTPIIELKDVWFRYGKNSPEIIQGLSMPIFPGEFLALLGGNGSGKTTLLSLISAVNQPYRGELRIKGSRLGKGKSPLALHLGALPQNPQTLFTSKTVKGELMEMLTKPLLSVREFEQQLTPIIDLCQLSELLTRHPYDLSGGEQQRLALAKLLLLKPDILLLDEPTKGLDAEFKQTLASILQEQIEKGVTIIMVSHDIEFCAKYADRCALLFDGQIVSADFTRPFFQGNSFYTTAANRMARHQLPAAVTADDVIIACGGSGLSISSATNNFNPLGLNEIAKLPENTSPEPSVVHFISSPKQVNQSSAFSIRLAALMLLVIIPLTIYTGIYYFGDRKYYFISILIIIETMLPFILMFEGRKPQARELIVISVLCALGVAGRTIFFMLPNFKPVAAIVIISALALGAETGFLVGVITAFVSNMFFGQGPWTPWQMLAYGLIGFLAGILGRKGWLKGNTLALYIFGGLATFFIYGGIMNPAAILMVQNHPTVEMFYLAFLQGFPFDLIHAASTVIFLGFIATPLLEKLDRIKNKYNIF